MKVVMIGQKGIPSRAGGVEVHVEELAAGLVKQGINVDVYCRKSYCEEIKLEHRGVKLKYIPSINTKSLDAITYTFLSTILALFKGYDIFHFHALGPSSMAWLPRLFGKKVICTVHGLDWKREKWGRFGKLYLRFGEKMIAKYASTIIVLSESMKNYFKDNWNRNSVVIHNGVYLGKKKESNIIRNKYNLEKDSYILFLARLVPEKGAHYLIEAYKCLNTNKKLVIAGGSSHTDKYVKQIQELGKNKNIIFTGFVKGEELEELYSNAYLYVLPSEIEGLPISLLEAMSYGNCCLVSDIEENKETMKNSGLYFKNGNYHSLTSIIEKLLLEDNTIEKYKNTSRNFVKQNYNWNKIILNTKNVYDNALYDINN